MKWFVPTARVGSTASAAFGGLFGWDLARYRFVLAFACGGVFFLTWLGAHGTVLGPASRGFLDFAGAPGARLGPSAAARCVRAGQADAAGADQAGHAEPGEQFFQIFPFHAASWFRMGMHRGLERRKLSILPCHGEKVYRRRRILSTVGL